LLGVVERWLPLAAPPPAATAGDAWTEARALPLGRNRTLGDGLLDEAALSKLAVDVGPDFLPSLVTSFTSEMDRRLLRVAEAKNRGDLAALALEAHAIKGSAGTFGAPALSAEALILERAAKSGETDQAWGKVSDLMAVAAETLSRLRDRFAGELDQGPA
jgi:HPt (histidine-containing phosphotransfer) domain-containing protein